MADRDSSPLFAPGQLLAGRFQIVRLLGRGGMGEVYEAEDRELGGTVALKTLLPSIARDPDALARFKREIQLAKTVTHKNVCRIFDIFHHRVETDRGEIQEIALFTMEMLKGETLKQRVLRQERMSSREADPIVRQIVDGLEAAHQAGVIHRDFKASNVMLVSKPGGGERAVITDFGLARASDGYEAPEGTLTVRGVVFGTPGYMAPEQERGGDTTAATDIYALGVVIYEMVTGELPAHRPPPEPRLYVQDLDPTWNDTILRCLEKEPADRFQDVREVLTALRSCKRIVRRRWLAAAAGFVAVVLLAGLVILRPAPTVALLGFRNVSGNPQTDYVGAMLLGMLSPQLRSGFKLSLVFDDTVARVERELGLPKAENFSQETLERLHENLQADVVVYGTYRAPRPGQVEVSVYVRKVPSGKLTTTFTETGNEPDLLPMIDQLGSRLRVALGAGKLSSAEKRSVHKVWPSAKAAPLYWAGLERLRASDARSARDFFEQALAAEPEYPLAHLSLAKALQQLGYARKATEHAEHALSGARGLPFEDKSQIEAYYWESRGDWDKAIKIYKEIVKLSPNRLGYGLRLAAAQTRHGDKEAALAIIESLRTSPSGDDPRLDLAAAAADPDRQLELAKTAEEKGLRRNSHLLVAQALYEQGRAYLSIPEYRKAMEAFERARQIYDKFDEDSALASTLLEKGSIFHAQAKHEEARQLFEEALAIYLRLGDRTGEAAALTNIGVVLAHQRGETSHAIENFESVGRIYEDLQDETAKCEFLINTALASAERGRLIEAFSQSEKALDVCHETGNLHYEEVAVGNHAYLLHSLGKLSDGKKQFEEALSIARSVNDETGQGSILIDMAGLSASQGEMVRAGRDYQAALALLRKHKEWNAVAEGQLASAGLFVAKGEFRDACLDAEQALNWFRERRQPEKEAKARAVLARALAAEGSLQKAEEEISFAQRLAENAESVVVRMTVQLAAGLVIKKVGEVEEARRLLAGVVENAHDSRYVGLELEASLELGRLEVEHGDRARGRARLTKLQKDAKDRGFRCIERDARRLLGGKPPEEKSYTASEDCFPESLGGSDNRSEPFRDLRRR